MVCACVLTRVCDSTCVVCVWCVRGVCVCVCVREREREVERERGRERETGRGERESMKRRAPHLEARTMRTQAVV